jgi:hypothetical protein
MRPAIEQFRISIQRVKDLISLHNSLQVQVTAALDISDILRAAWVLAVSALDYYIHESVTLGMLEIHQGLRSEPQPNPNTSQSAFSRFKVSLGSAREDRLTAMEIASWIEDEVRKSRGSDFLQEPQHFSAFIPAISEGIASKLNSDFSTSWLEYEIREKLGYQSFQKPDKIADVIRYISDRFLSG